jgi:hypothetical protein
MVAKMGRLRMMMTRRMKSARSFALMFAPTVRELTVQQVRKLAKARGFMSASGE